MPQDSPTHKPVAATRATRKRSRPVGDPADAADGEAATAASAAASGAACATPRAPSPPPTAAATSPSAAPPEPKALESCILEILRARRAGATCCPSEAPRRLRPKGDWRALMGPARDAARRLARAGEIEITQRGQVVDPEGAFHGPIRLRLRQGPP
ncbi:MAG: hypothetical protein J3K34DRAFT_435218 [Monoraphidium minutum]|nr:MAG: hypothetical protein J3K34DRAFT_435218 [Monoraphidium minutum]